MREMQPTEEPQSSDGLAKDLRAMLTTTPESPGLPASPLEEASSKPEEPVLVVAPAEVRTYQPGNAPTEQLTPAELERQRAQDRVVSLLRQIERDVRQLRSRLGERDYDGQEACLNTLEQLGQLSELCSQTDQAIGLDRAAIMAHMADLQRLLYKLPYKNEAHGPLETALSDQLLPVLRQYLAIE